MTFQPKTAYIVSHTHWDREWYLPFHQFRVNMFTTVKKVLEALENDAEYKHFLLDGQSIILEDFLEIHPEDESRIRNLVQKGALSIGPWYILPDEFIIGAESHVRNLIYGHKVSARFGKAQKAGYMPDSFGHIAQIPQILKQAGIESFIYTRGNGDEIDDLGHEFTWRAPDGSEVIAINQCGGYDNCAALGFDGYSEAQTRRKVITEKAVEKVGRIFDRMAKRSNGDIVLLNSGGDHLPPQQEFGRIIEALRKAFPDTEFKHTSLVEYINAIKNAGIAHKKFTGELIGGKLQMILSGVWSTRIYLKQKNDESQNLLTNYLEPISSYSHFMLGGEYPSGLVEYAWKLLLKNHPHDSICGCSTDDVHREMIPRFDGVIQTAKQEITNQLENMNPTFARKTEDDGETVICVMNPLPIRRTEVLERLVILQQPGIEPESLHLFDENGNEIQFKIIRKWHFKRFWTIDYRTIPETENQLEKFNEYFEQFKSESEKDKIDSFFLVQFTADLPPLGHKLYRFTVGEASLPSKNESDVDKVDISSIENEFCCVKVHPNGSFDLLDKKSGRQFTGLNILEDTEDVGDEYDYSYCKNSKTYTTEKSEGDIEIIEDTALKTSIEVSLSFKIPEKIAENRQSRSRKLVDCPVKVRISLGAGSPVVDINLEFDNRTQDHRLRALFPAGIKTDCVISDGHFFANERTIEHPLGADWFQPPVKTYPGQDFSLLQDENGGLTIFNRGLIEFEPIYDSDGGAGLALTLLRSVGWLSRDDFPTRKFMNAGPTIATPDAQCLGKNKFHYAIVAFQGNWIDAGIKQLSQRWRVPPIMVQGVEDLSIPGTDGLVETWSNRISITAIKKHEERDTLVIRLYNLTDSQSEEMLKFGRDVKKAWIVNLLEERTKELTPEKKRTLRVPMKPHGIVSVEVEF